MIRIHAISKNCDRVVTVWKDCGKIITGDALEQLAKLPDKSVNMCVTSPPYWGLRNYGVLGQIGLEKTPSEYVSSLCAVFAQVKRILHPTGTLWLNLGDTYLKNKNLAGIPWQVAFVLQNAGWILRTEIIWSKPNPMPESVKDRPTRSHEYLFLFSKKPNYFYDYDAIREEVAGYSNGKWQSEKSLSFARVVNEPERPNQQYSQHRVDRQESCITKKRSIRPGIDIKGDAQGSGEISFQNGLRNRRSVWTVAPKPCHEAHFATFPPELIRPCILAGCPENGIVLDPFFGSGTVGVVCLEEKRQFIGIELNPKYVKIAEKRLEAKC